MLNWIKNLVGDTNEKHLKKIDPYVRAINALEDEIQAMSDEELHGLTAEFRERLAEGETLDDLLPEAFATVREVARRVIGQRHYDVQLIGGVVLHQGKIAEMRTGEGKTLVATLPLYLNALAGNGCHLITVNDYLAKVGAGWMAPIYHFLGLSVGYIAHDQSALYDPEYIDPHANPEDQRLIHWRPVKRQEAYAADITYGTNNEFGFDYLRDNMALRKEQMVQRGHYFAIIDEVDNILIDEARTPLIISGPAQKSSDEYHRMAQIIGRLDLQPSSVTLKEAREGIEHDGDYVLEERTRSLQLTDMGIEKVERALGIPAEESLYDPQYFELTHYLDNALKARFIFHRDKDYMVSQDGQVVIIDEFTGRAMPGRRWSDGLHQAVEAKEGLEIRNENVTMATITFQNYFRLYQKLAGMTGTAYTEREEFARFYNLEVTVIPTHRPVVREDYPDLVFRDVNAKFHALIDEVQEMHAAGRPVLIGTTSVETSEDLSKHLKAAKIFHRVLNAKQHEREASVVAQAGRVGAVTVATNMAGRGTDILLGGNPDGLVEEILERQGITVDDATPEQQAAAFAEAKQITGAERAKVLELGGLHIIGTERHEARRIDNQLRGRAGRQGDKGSSRFYISLEDELMRRFGRLETVKRIMDGISGDEDIPIEHRMLDKVIEGAQSRVEGYNFDIRKHTVEFDDVMNTQRKIIYSDRKAILEGQDMHERVLEMIGEEIASQIDQYLPYEERDEWDLDGLLRAARTINPLLPEDLTTESFATLTRDEIEERLIAEVEQAYAIRGEAIGSANMRYVERRMMLGAIDRQWVDYLTGIDELRQSINLQAFAQRDPLVEFKKQSFDMFDALKENITRDIVYEILPQSFAFEEYLQRIEQEQQARLAAAQAAQGGSAGSATTTRAPRQPVRRVVRIGRNEPCPCGSGRKFKDCHLGREAELAAAITAATAPQLATANQPSAAAVAVPQAAAPVAAPVAPQSQSEPQSQQQPAPRGRATAAVPRGRKAPPPANGNGNGNKQGGKQKKGDKARA